MLRKDPNHPDWATGSLNLASYSLGARSLFVTDDFFAPAERMLYDAAPVWREGIYDDNGKWMDGWESRRKRGPGHDYCIIKLATSGRILGFDIDTTFFTGNFAPAISIEGTYAPRKLEENPDWQEILPKTELNGNSRLFAELTENGLSEQLWTHLRVHIYPDGGVARLRVYGTAHFDWSLVGEEEEVDLAFIFHGAKALHWSNAHFGRPERLLAPGRGVNMGDGWETARRRGPGYDWTILALGHRGKVDRVIIDTAHFKGNYPEFGEVLGADLSEYNGFFTEAMIAQSEVWSPLLTKKRLNADSIHEFTDGEVNAIGPVTHVRLNMFPDGGISRLRLYGRKS